MYKLQKKDIPKARTVLIDAFQQDPVWNKVFEGESELDEKLYAFYETPIRYCLKYGEVLATSESLEGIAAWVPGNLADMTIWRLILSGAIGSGMKMGASLGKKMKPVYKLLQEDRKKNMMRRAFIYLFIMGVASEHQGKGFGGKLLRALIEKSEQTGIPIYLETETESNVGMYKRFDFKLVKKIALPAINLPMWEMVREPNM